MFTVGVWLDERPDGAIAEVQDDVQEVKKSSQVVLHSVVTLRSS